MVFFFSGKNIASKIGKNEGAPFGSPDTFSFRLFNYLLAISLFLLVISFNCLHDNKIAAIIALRF